MRVNKQKIIVSLFQGRYFPRNPSSKVYFQCNFMRQLLLTEPVDLVYEPVWDSQMIWEIEPKVFHYMRTTRTCLKIVCYAIDGGHRRESLGYIMLDLRNTTGLPWKEVWCPLVNVKGPMRPEVKLAFAVIDSLERVPSIVRERKEERKEERMVVEDGRDEMRSVKIVRRGYCEYCVGDEFGVEMTLEFKIKREQVKEERLVLKFLGDTIMFSNSEESFEKIKLVGTIKSFVELFDEMEYVELLAVLNEEIRGSARIDLTLLLKNYDGNDLFYDFQFDLMNQENNDNVENGEKINLSIECKFEPIEAETQKVEKEKVDLMSKVEKVYQKDIKTNKPNNKPNNKVDNKVNPLNPFTSESNSSNNLWQSPSNNLSDMLHHYKYSVDLKSVHNVDIQNSFIYLRYLYSPFGTHATFKTHPSVLISRSQQTHFDNSFCSYEFVMTETQIQNYMVNVPILVEMCSKEEDETIGIGEVRLADVYLQESKKTEKGIAWVYHGVVGILAKNENGKIIKICDLRYELIFEDLGIINSPVGGGEAGVERVTQVEKVESPRSKSNALKLDIKNKVTGKNKIGNENVDSAMQVDFDDSRLKGDRPSHINSTTASPTLNNTVNHAVKQTNTTSNNSTNTLNNSTTKDPISNQTTSNQVSSNLPTSNIASNQSVNNFLEILADEWKMKEKEREKKILEKMTEFNLMEEKIKKTIQDLEMRERKIKINENEINSKISEFEKERKSLLTEIKDSARRIQEEYQHKLELEKNKVKDLESNKSILKNELLNLNKVIKDLEEENRRLKNEYSTIPDVKLLNQINQLMEKNNELESKLNSTIKSKKHYKFEWVKSLKECEKLKELERAREAERVKKLEVERLKEVERIREAERMKELELHEMKILKEMENKRFSRHRRHKKKVYSSSDSTNDDIERLLKEKEILFATGLYDENDPVIVYINDNIAKLRK